MPIRLSEIPTEQPIRLSELPPEPSKWTIPRTLGGKATKAALKYTGKGLWTGLNVLGWPFQRAEYMTAGFMDAALKARHKTKDTTGFGAFAPLGPLDTRGTEEYKEVGRAMVPALKSLVTWKPPEGVKTWTDVFKQYQTMMHGPGVESYQMPNPLAGLTSLPPPIGPAAQTILPFLDKDVEVSPEASATAAGIGTSFLTSPKIVSGAFKGLTRLGKATPWYKSYAASRLPTLENLALEHGADKAAGIEQARKLGKTVSKKALKPIAAKLFGVAKPSKTQIAATTKRLKQIEQGGVTTSPELAKTAGGFADFWAKNRPILEKAKLLGEETIFTKLTKARKAGLNKQIAQLQSQLKKLQKAPYQDTLKKAAKGLSIKGQRTVENQIVRLVTKLNKGSQPEKVAAEKALNKITSQLATQNIQGKNPLINQIVKLVRKYNLSGGKDRIDIKTHLVRLAERAAKQNISGRQKILATAQKLVANLEKADATRQVAIREQLVKLGEQAQKQGLTGLRPLLKKIASMKRRFPGQSGKIRQIQDKIDDIKLQIYRSEHLGGTLPSGESVPLKYAPRMYSQYEKGGRRWPFYSKFRIRRPYAKQRKDIPLQVRKEMGEITGMGYPEVKRAMQVSNDVATADLFNKIAKTPGWVDDAAEGFKQIPTSKAFGILSGRAVHPTVYNQVKMVVDVRSSPAKFHDALLGTWKQFKLQSLALLGRNKVSNTILNDITGTDPIDQIRMTKRLIGEIKNNTDEWKTINRYLLRSGFNQAELMDELLNVSQGGKPSGALDAFAKVLRGVRRYTGAEAFGRAYGRAEQFDKALKYLHMREKGMTAIEAVKEANRALFDYGALHPLEKTVARRIMPFYTFPRKAIPVVLQSMRDNPYAVAKYPVMFWGTQQYSLSKLKMSEEDYDRLAEKLPAYLDRDSTLLMPWRDKDGKLELYDWTYVLPWGPMAEMNQRGLIDVAVSHPLYTLLSNIQTNYNTFTGKKIYDDSIPWDEMTPGYKREQRYKIFKFGWQLAAPPYAPGGIYFDKLDEAFRKQTRSKLKALFHTGVGFRTTAVDPKEAEMWHYKGVDKQLKSLSGQLWGLSYKKAQDKITTEKYERKKKIILDQMKQTTQTNLLLKTTR